MCVERDSLVSANSADARRAGMTVIGGEIRVLSRMQQPVVGHAVRGVLPEVVTAGVCVPGRPKFVVPPKAPL